MNKKIFGIKIATILQFLFCIILAFVIWFVVQYTNASHENAEAVNLFSEALSQMHYEVV